MLTGCSSTNVGSKDISVTVANNLNFNRNEVVTIPRKELLQLLKQNNEQLLGVFNTATNQFLPVQWIDYDGDNKGDELLFMADVAAKGKAYYKVITNTVTVKSELTTYSRFVPERTDDYTWENDKIAFRVYGPKGQKEALEGISGSTMSSGVDIWLKRTNQPVINKWYAGHVKQPGYYHKDHGEGYDPYHVGNSRGNGGSGIWLNDSLLVSQNYISYKTIATGPLRTVFELDYAPWSPYGVHETKRISLDLGANFSKFEVSLTADKPLPNYTIGITLHENKGEAKISPDKKWFRHWEPIDDSFVGEGILLDPATVTNAFVNKSTTPDQSNLLIITKPKDKVTYYAGFAWQKSGQVDSVSGWDAMLEKQAQIIAHPLQVSFDAK